MKLIFNNLILHILISFYLLLGNCLAEIEEINDFSKPKIILGLDFVGSASLIDTENKNSIYMANSLNYEIFQTWNYYSLNPKKNPNFKIEFVKSINSDVFPFYVDSWRWIETTKKILLDLSTQNKIIRSTLNGKTSVAIISDYKHLDKTLIVTLFSGSFETLFEILSYLQNHAFEKNYERIQILTKDELKSFDSLEYKISFNLMKKSLI